MFKRLFSRSRMMRECHVRFCEKFSGFVGRFTHRELFMLLGFISVTIQAANVVLITHCYNRPEFIEIQYKTFKHFLKDNYEYVVFNDANNENIKQQIDDTCSRLGVRCMRIPQKIHTRPYLVRQPGDNLQQANIRHANCVQFSLDVLGFEFDGIVVILDSDMFLIRPFSFSRYMEGKDIAAFLKASPSRHLLSMPGSLYSIHE